MQYVWLRLVTSLYAHVYTPLDSIKQHLRTPEALKLFSETGGEVYTRAGSEKRHLKHVRLLRVLGHCNAVQLS
jgi:hypothetical protein